MGMYGNIVLFPIGGRAPSEPLGMARRLIRVFEDAGLVAAGTSTALPRREDCSVTFEESFEEGAFADADCAYLVVDPDRLKEALGDIVYVLAEDEHGHAAPIELPYLEVTVASRAVPVLGSVSQRMPRELWAAIEFSYEDARLSEEIHRVRNESHPVLASLKDVLGCPVGWDVVAY